jgi:hypothetical protein
MDFQGRSIIACGNDSVHLIALGALDGVIQVDSPRKLRGLRPFAKTAGASSTLITLGALRAP